MKADQVINELEKLGVKLEVTGDRLRFAPRELVPDSLLSEMVSHKADLLSLIKKRERKLHYKLKNLSMCVPVVMPCEVGCNRNIAFYPQGGTLYGYCSSCKVHQTIYHA